MLSLYSAPASSEKLLWCAWRLLKCEERSLSPEKKDADTEEARHEYQRERRTTCHLDVDWVEAWIAVYKTGPSPGALGQLASAFNAVWIHNNKI